MANNDIGIDLGTTSVIICTGNGKIVLNEPSVLAIDTRSGKVLAVGAEAFNMVGRTPAHIHAVRPLKDGVISDHLHTQELIKAFVRRVYDARLVKPRVAVCVPSAITGIESDAVVEAVMLAGARQVFLIDEPLAAAIGSDIDISQPRGHMAIDIGGGTTDVAVISLGGRVEATSLDVAGNTFDEEIIRYVRLEHMLAIGEKTAEQLKHKVASCIDEKPFSASMEVKGRSLVTGMPQRLTLATKDLLPTVLQLADRIAAAAHTVLERTPPELAADLLDDGIILTGGGAKLKGMPEYFSQKLKVCVRRAEDPVHSVALGTFRALSMMDTLESGFYDATPKGFSGRGL